VVPHLENCKIKTHGTNCTIALYGYETGPLAIAEARRSGAEKCAVYSVNLKENMQLEAKAQTEASK
jgi:hypothetical protein